MKFLSIASISLVSVIVVQALPNKLAELGEVVIQIGSKPKPSILKTNVKYASSNGKGILEEAQFKQRLTPNEANEAWARHIEESSPNVVQTRRIQISDEVREHIIPARPNVAGVKHNFDSIENPTDVIYNTQRPSKIARIADKSDEASTIRASVFGRPFYLLD